VDKRAFSVDNMAQKWMLLGRGSANLWKTAGGFFALHDAARSRAYSSFGACESGDKVALKLHLNDLADLSCASAAFEIS
jgi:hypothetical protein